MHHLLRIELNNDNPEVPREILIFNPLALMQKYTMMGTRVLECGHKSYLNFL